MPHFTRLLVAALWIALLAPQEARADAWTLPKGHIWTKITFLKQSTDEEYVAVGGAGRAPDPSRVYQAGDRARYRFDGSYDSRAVFFDLFYGVTDRFEIGVQLPFFPNSSRTRPF